jgi:hypothetical protein
MTLYFHVLQKPDNRSFCATEIEPFVAAFQLTAIPAEYVRKPLDRISPEISTY